MKFVFFGYDFMLSLAHRLIDDGHELIGILSFECDNVFNFNRDCQILATNLNIPLIMSPPTDIHLDSFINKNADIFLSAGYPYKIPPIDEEKAYGINIHPSHLPRARGLMPVPHILTNHDEAAAGLTIHKLAPKFDQGDIIAQHQIPLDPNESVETYCAKILLKAPDMISTVFTNIEELWSAATIQNEDHASHAPTPTEDMRLLDWAADLQDIKRTANAFGRFGCLAQFENTLWSVMDLDGWESLHEHTPGTCLILQPKLAVIAVNGGYICLKDFQKMDVPQDPQ